MKRSVINTAISATIQPQDPIVFEQPPLQQHYRIVPAAKIMGLAPQTLRNKLARGEIPEHLRPVRMVIGISAFSHSQLVALTAALVDTPAEKPAPTRRGRPRITPAGKGGSR